MNAMIEVKQLVRRFGATTALEAIDFSVPDGALCGFIGPNGAGKSTTMRILATLDLPTEGEARIAGLDVTQQPLAVRELIGYMPDFGGSFPNITGDEYLDFFARAYHLKGAKREQRIAATVAFTELQGLLDRPVDGLSKGQKQRLSLARALLPDPKVLILDEPAEGLDPRARLELRNLLKLLASEHGKTVLISSHILSELDDLIDYAVVIDQGRLVFAGTRAQLLALGREKASGSGQEREDAEGLRVEDVDELWRLQLSDAVESVQKWLLTREGVKSATLDGSDGSELLVHLDAQLLPGPQLLREMVEARFAVRQWRLGERGLEDSFLDLTGSSW